MPMRNLLAILSAVGVGVWAFFGIQERLNTLETRNTLMEADLVENTAFRIGWPRGEMGSLPADSAAVHAYRIYVNPIRKNAKTS